jgi:hypothetical protein
MSNAWVAAWTACIKELLRLVNTASVAQAEVQAFDRVVAELSKQPQPLPHAVWKKLVQDVQVTCADTINTVVPEWQGLRLSHRLARCNHFGRYTCTQRLIM